MSSELVSTYQSRVFAGYVYSGERLTQTREIAIDNRQ